MSRSALQLLSQGRRIALCTASTAQFNVNSGQLATLRCCRLSSSTAKDPPSSQSAVSSILPASSSSSTQTGTEQQARVPTASTAGAVAGQTPSCPDRLLQSVEVVCQGNERAVLASYAKFIDMTCEHLSMQKLPIEFMKDTRQRMTLLKSAFKHKDHRVQYEMRTYAFKLVLLRLTGSTAGTFIEYIQRMCPENIAMKVKEYELQKFPPAVENFLKDVRKKRKSSQAETQEQ